MFQSLVDAVSGSSWTYGLIFAVSMLDAFFPLVPSETIVIAAGVLCAQGDLVLPLVMVSAATGAIVGDNISFAGGHFLGERLVQKYFTGKRKPHLDRAERALDERGGYLIVVARFIPGGRTVVTFAAGTLEWRWLRFLRWDVLAGTIWGVYATMLGYLGGSTFEDSPFKGFLLAFGIALFVTVMVEFVRWYRKRAAHS